jgi:glutamate racemase
MYPKLPIIGIEPALKPAVLWKEHDRVAVMATPATLSLEKFQNLLHTYDSSSKIYSIPCPGLMDFVERGELDGPELEQFLSNLLSPYLSKGLDAIVLGCTHYPFVEKTIQKIAGPSIRIFNGSYGTAMELKRRLICSGIKRETGRTGQIDICNSNGCSDTIKLCHRLLEA